MKLPRLFSAGMVVQQELPIPVWGWSKPGQAVRVTLAGRNADTVAGPKGTWMVRLPPLKAADHIDAALTLTVIGDETVTVDDVAVGEVWLCSGQSNMEWPVYQTDDAQREIVAAKFPRIRLFTVEHATASIPSEDVQPGAKWLRCSPDTIARFSAVSYFFGRELHQSLRVPVGLILSAWGGTLAEAWTSRAALASEAPLRPILDRLATMPTLPSADSAAYTRALKTWETKAYHLDPGNQGARKGWAKTNFADDAWPQMDLPRSWESAGLDIDGAVWFRRAVEIPATWKGKALSLSLGPIDDFDTTYVNGVEVGGITSDTPDAHTVPRIYTVPGKVVTGKRLVIAVRVFDRHGQGGLVGDPTQLTLALAPTKAAAKGKTGTKKITKKATDKPLSLAGDWRYQIELRLEPRRNLPPQPLHATHQDLPATLNNAMIQPLVPYGLRGAIWYQGESNAERAEQYRSLLPALLRDWRMAWGQRDFHVGIVQLANWRERRPTPGPSDWAELREAQAMTASQTGNGLAVTIDLGNATDIHPRNKLEVGRRLALWARFAVYQQVIPRCGPQYASTTIDGTSVRLRFTHVDGGLASRDGGALTGFAIAGADRTFVWAETRIQGAEVVVSSPKVPKPMAVRYAWADNPACNLVNGAMLPAAPFRTDDWPLSTAGRR